MHEGFISYFEGVAAKLVSKNVCNFAPFWPIPTILLQNPVKPRDFLKKINVWRQYLQGLISMLKLQFYSSDLLNLPKELNIWRAAVGQVLILKCEVWKSKESVPRNAEKLETSAICLQRRESINDVFLYRVPKIKFNASSTGFVVVLRRISILSRMQVGPCCLRCSTAAAAAVPTQPL